MNDPMPRRESGFTLIELLVVTTVIGVLAGVAVPNLITSRLVANEAAVIATVRAVATAQQQFQSSAALDTDQDSVPEYGTFGELAAIEPLRGTAAPLSRNLLSKSVAQTDGNGWATHHGYHFCLYLPAADGAGVAAVAANAGLVDGQQAQSYWSCVAWPVEAGTTGRRTFFVNHQGQVLQAREAGYSGSSAVPAAGCGLVGVAVTHIDSQQLAADMIGADGQLWAVVH